MDQQQNTKRVLRFIFYGKCESPIRSLVKVVFTKQFCNIFYSIYLDAF